jgi:glycosyltransferase involved in cell wall biosynthesis
MDRLEEKYHLSAYSKQLPICVIVPTRNNAQNYRYEYNIQSIINQDYKNYHAIFIDDASEDRTADLIQLFISRNKLPHARFRLIRNKQRRTAIPNIYDATINYCALEDIAVIVSGDDELLGKQVFKIINAIYQSKKPAVAYTNHFFGKLNEGDFELGYSRAYTFGETKNRLFRFIGQKFGHMRTFLVSLFREIRVEDLRDRDGNWLTTTYDEAFFIPMLEMACDSVEYIDEYVYIYNYGTGNSDGQVRHQVQADNAIYVRSQPRYNCLQKYQKYAI